MAEEILYNPGSVIIEDVFITSLDGIQIDLRNFMVELNLYEDVFSPFMHGDIVISDSAGLTVELPIVGNEVLTFRFRTPTFPSDAPFVIEKSMQIYAIENRVLNNDREELMVLQFISREGYIDATTTLSETFSGNTSDVAASIFIKHLSGPRRIDKQNRDNNNTNLTVLDTPHASNIKFTAAYWSPLKCLYFISKRVRGAEYDASDCLFFESNKGFYFTGLEAAIDGQIKNKALFDDYFYDTTGLDIYRRDNGYTYYGLPMPAAWFTRVQNLKALKTLNTLEGQQSGYYANAVRGYNFYTKQMEEVYIDLPNTPDQYTFKKTGRGFPIPNKITANPYINEQFYPLNDSLYNNYGPNIDNYGEQIVKRKSYLNSFDQFKFEISIPGRTDIEVGQMIHFSYPKVGSKPSGATYEDAMNKILSGPYLITAMHHKFNAFEHSIKAEIVKNGLKYSLSVPGQNEVVS